MKNLIAKKLKCFLLNTVDRNIMYHCTIRNTFNYRVLWVINNFYACLVTLNAAELSHKTTNYKNKNEMNEIKESKWNRIMKITTIQT